MALKIDERPATFHGCRAFEDDLMREVTEKVAARKPKYHGRIKCVECRRWMRPEPDAKTPLKRRPSPVASHCVECPVGLILKSTRSDENADARRDFDNFDVNEELCRARRALHEIDRGEYAERSPDALRAFAAECFANIDEWLSRGGDLPSAWRSSNAAKRVTGCAEQS